MNLPSDPDTGAEPALLSVGDITVTANWVYTPQGRHPLRGSVWTATNMTHTIEKISTAGIVLAVLFVWACFLGLLFLLMKERRIVGHVQVTVQGDGFHHAVMLPVEGIVAVNEIHDRVNYARTVAASA